MDLNPPEFWWCSACTYADNPWWLVECEMSGAAVRREAKRTPEDAAPPVAALKLAKQVKEALAVGSLGTSRPTAKNDPTVPAVHPVGMVLEIVGMARGDCGQNCDEHTCCDEVLEEDEVVHLRREQIVVPNKLGKGEKEETADTVNWVTDGHDRCLVGLLPRAYVAQGGMFDGVLCQVISVGKESDNNNSERAHGAVLFLFLMSVAAQTLEMAWKHAGIRVLTVGHTPDEELHTRRIRGHPPKISLSRKLIAYEIFQLLYVDDGGFPFPTRSDLIEGVTLIHSHLA